MERKAPQSKADAVVDGTIARMLEIGYSGENIRHYRTACEAIKNFHTKAGTGDYSSGITARYVENERLRYESGAIGRRAYFTYRRFAVLSDAFYVGRALICGNAMSEKAHRVSDAHRLLLDNFANEVLNSRYEPRTIRGKISSIRTLLFYVEDCFQGDLSALTTTGISDFLTETASRRRSSMRLLIDDNKQFLEFLISREIVNRNVLSALDIYAPRDKKIYVGFTHDEAHRIVEAVDRTTVLGKRDYAMLVLAKQTGIRGVDIRHLKLGDIHWKAAEIHFVQQKTRRPLVLPLDASVGNAIADYILILTVH